MAKNKNLDRNLLHYGVRQEDMALIAQTCQDCDIEFEWLKEYILKPYNEERTNNNALTVDDKKLSKILKKALKNI